MNPLHDFLYSIDDPCEMTDTLLDNEVRLYIPRDEEHLAVKMGVKRRGQKWFATNLEHLCNFQEYDLEFLLEDRTFGGNDLYIDLIPKPCWGKSLYKMLRATEWNRVKKAVHERSKYTCEICHTNCYDKKGKLHAHERWSYDSDMKIQKLERIMSLCKDCHLSTHFGYASINGEEDRARDHLQRITQMTAEDVNQHIEEAYKLWRERSHISWEQDFSIIEDCNIRLKK